ncbi:MAG: peptide deformylase [Chloroflexi bacterium]|nr:peptide deformylase [Chloroflexota bacterium]
MAVLPILELPHPALRKRAKKVKTIDSSILELAHDMVDTMRKANGVGLAANQVGALWRVITVQLPEEQEARIYINPEIVYREGEREIEEGCLSIPGYRGYIKRSVWIRFRALDHTAKVVKLKAEELLSQALEHEVDHLNGILYIDHLESHQKLEKIEPEETSEAGASGSHDAREAIPSELVSQNGVEGHFKKQGALYMPDSDALDTPASLKVK